MPLYKFLVSAAADRDTHNQWFQDHGEAANYISAPLVPKSGPASADPPTHYACSTTAGTIIDDFRAAFPNVPYGTHSGNRTNPPAPAFAAFIDGLTPALQTQVLPIGP